MRQVLALLIGAFLVVLFHEQINWLVGLVGW
jgi:hypothetical protein